MLKSQKKRTGLVIVIGIVLLEIIILLGINEVDNNWLSTMEEKVIMSDGRLSKYKVQTKYTGGILKNLIKELKQEFAFNEI